MMASDARRGTDASPRFDYLAFIARYGGATIEKCAAEQTVYAQDDPADAAFYIVGGTVKITARSTHDAEAVVALLKENDFFGEECLYPDRCRAVTAVASTDCVLVRLDRRSIVRALGDDADFGHVYLDYVIRQNNPLRQEANGQLFQSSEKRLVRILLSLINAHMGRH